MNLTSNMLIPFLPDPTISSDPNSAHQKFISSEIELIDSLYENLRVGSMNHHDENRVVKVLTATSERLFGFNHTSLLESIILKSQSVLCQLESPERKAVFLNHLNQQNVRTAENLISRISTMVEPAFSFMSYVITPGGEKIDLQNAVKIINTYDETLLVQEFDLYVDQILNTTLDLRTLSEKIRHVTEKILVRANYIDRLEVGFSIQSFNAYKDKIKARLIEKFIWRPSNAPDLVEIARKPEESISTWVSRVMLANNKAGYSQNNRFGLAIDYGFSNNADLEALRIEYLDSDRYTVDQQVAQAATRAFSPQNLAKLPLQAVSAVVENAANYAIAPFVDFVASPLLSIAPYEASGYASRRIEEKMRSAAAAINPSIIFDPNGLASFVTRMGKKKFGFWTLIINMERVVINPVKANAERLLQPANFNDILKETVSSLGTCIDLMNRPGITREEFAQDITNDPAMTIEKYKKEKLASIKESVRALISRKLYVQKQGRISWIEAIRSFIASIFNYIASHVVGNMVVKSLSKIEHVNLRQLKQSIERASPSLYAMLSSENLWSKLEQAGDLGFLEVLEKSLKKAADILSVEGSDTPEDALQSEIDLKTATDTLIDKIPNTLHTHVDVLRPVTVAACENVLKRVDLQRNLIDILGRNFSTWIAI